MPRILISAGHTMMDVGAIFRDLREADLTRKIAPKIIPYLTKAGQEVIAVPLDLPLWQRLEWINNNGYSEQNGDVLLEVHINDSDGTKRGVEAWYKGDTVNPSHKLAFCITEKIKQELGYEIQGIRSEREHELGSLTFLSRSNPAPVLLECLYMDNDHDIAILKDDSALEKLAQAIANGILYYLDKDADGKVLQNDQRPDYSSLKPYVAPASPAGAMPGMPPMPNFDMGDDFDDDMDDLFGGLGDPGLNTANAIQSSNTFSPPPAPVPMSTPAPVNPTPSPTFSPTPTPGFPSFGGGMGGFGSPTPSMGGSMMMDREQRKKMIEDNYVKFLGEKPSQSDLNYFLNMGISEADLVKKMVESQKHQDLIKAKQEHEELKKKHTDIEIEHKRLQVRNQDLENMLKHQEQSLEQKKQRIFELESMLVNQKGIPSGALSSSLNQEESKNPHVKRKKSRKERILQYFSRKLS